MFLRGPGRSLAKNANAAPPIKFLMHLHFQWVGFGRVPLILVLTHRVSPTRDLTRRCKADNQVTHVFRPVERQKMPATLERRHLGAFYQRAIVLAF